MRTVEPGPSRKRVGALGVLWALAFVQALTIQPSRPFTFPEPLSWEQWGLVAAFLLTSVGLLGSSRRRVVLAAHAAVVAGLLVLHPLTAFGRDGSAVVLIAWLGVVLARMGIRREWLLAFASSALALLATEALLAALRPPDTPVDLADYGAVMDEYGPCGFLRPKVTMNVVGEDGPARFMTNSLGLRSDWELAPNRPPEGFRILFLGDSFVAGYRTDQDETIGARLESMLSERFRRRVEVLAAGSGYPGASVRVAATCSALVHPDLILVGVTLGNDLSQSWLGQYGFPASVVDGLFLPADASKDWGGLLPIKLLRSVRAWRVFRRAEALVGTEVISSWYRDAPTRVHLFDAGHSLGHFYVRRELDVVAESYEASQSSFTAIAGVAERLGIQAVFVLFPQRFQVSDREWRATLFEYGLDPAAFDRDAPNRRLATACSRAGLTCVDLLSAFRLAAAAGPLYQAHGDMHWNRLGHATAARALADLLELR